MNPAANNKGMALLLALFVVAILISVTVELGTTVNWQLHASYNQADTVRLDAMLTSGLNTALALLVKDEEEKKSDTLLDPWASYDSDTLSSFFGGEKVTLSVGDLTGRLQVNSLIAKDETDAAKKVASSQRELWLRFLTSGAFAIEGDEEAKSVLDALSDWIDSDDEERLFGAENSYYQALSPGFECPNDVFTRPDQLSAVKGMTKELLYGTAEYEGLINYITVYGRDGKININTADPLILAILHESIPADFVEGLVEYRQDETNKDQLTNINWYQNVTGAPNQMNLSLLLRVTGEYYRVSVTAEYERLRRQGVATVRRTEKGALNVLSWHVE